METAEEYELLSITPAPGCSLWIGTAQSLERNKVVLFAGEQRTMLPLYEALEAGEHFLSVEIAPRQILFSHAAEGKH